MIFQLDTDHYDEIKLTFSENEHENGLPKMIEEFCYGVSAFFVDFAMKLECDTKDAASLKEICLSCIANDIDVILEHGILEPAEDEKRPEEENF